MPSPCWTATARPKPLAGPACEHDAALGRVDRGADRGGDVDAGVQRAPAGAVAGGDPAAGRGDGAPGRGQRARGLPRRPAGSPRRRPASRAPWSVEQPDLGLAQLRVERGLLGGDGVEGALRGGQLGVGGGLGLARRRAASRSRSATAARAARSARASRASTSSSCLELLGALVAEDLEGGGLLQQLGGAVGVQQEGDVAEGVVAAHVGLAADGRRRRPASASTAPRTAASSAAVACASACAAASAAWAASASPLAASASMVMRWRVSSASVTRAAMAATSAVDRVVRGLGAGDGPVSPGAAAAVGVAEQERRRPDRRRGSRGGLRCRGRRVVERLGRA